MLLPTSAYQPDGGAETQTPQRFQAIRYPKSLPRAALLRMSRLTQDNPLPQSNELKFTVNLWYTAA